MSYTYGPGGREIPIFQKLREFNWSFVFLICVIGSIGVAMLYSTAQGNMEPWASRQLIRFIIGLCVLFVVAMVDIRVWMSLAYPAYVITLAMLIGVEFAGVEGKGAQRWLDLGLFRVQPSEVMKIALVLALARYIHGQTFPDMSRIRKLVPALVLVAIPVAFVLRQPDLGTSLLLLVGSGMMLFLAGVSWRIVGVAGATAVGAAVVGWQFLKEYQKQRVLTFMSPESDPMGAGYHILQSKIALGSGGVFGKGYLQGTQSQLNFLPEKHTDFIFTMYSEEFGLMGGIVLLGLYFVLLAYGFYFSYHCRNHFGRLVCTGVMATFLLYIVINVAMVMGLLPVVGVPLPLVSYGGTAMMTLMFGFGLVMSVWVHREIEIPLTSKGMF